MAKCDQVAYYARTEEDAYALKSLLGLEDAEWIEDIVTAKCMLFDGRWSQSVGKLRFNYTQGVELEILTYLEGDHWHRACNPFWHSPHGFFISHIGYHLEPGEDFPDTGLRLVQETFTQSHTSEYLTTGAGAGRKYHYRIHEVIPGNYVKFIKRINP